MLTLSVNDGRMEHVNLTSENQTIIEVGNSAPRAIINAPTEGETVDSSTLIEFNSSGSGDWDSACSTFPVDVEWYCSQSEPASGSEYLVYRWESSLDGILQENGSDWLIFEGRLSAGNHVITLSMDDGINPISTSSINITVSQSAPVMGLLSPSPEIGYHSSDEILFDISNSIDYDNDNFTFNLSSNISGILLSSMDASNTNLISLDAGIHEMSVKLTDETGMSRIESFVLTVVESDPVVEIYSPLNNQFYEPGEIVILDSNGTFDADNDLTRREWRLYSPNENNPEVLSNNAYFETKMQPGVHHISLFVEDRRGGSDEVHVNITVASSNPDLSNLSISETKLEIDELTEITVSVRLDDPDGTTSLVQAIIKKNTQQWEFNLTDVDNDGVWTGSINVISSDTGKAQLKVTAIDGEIIDYVTKDIDFVKTETDNAALINILSGVGGLILIAGLVAFFVIRRRKKLADLDLIDSWGVFGGEIKEYVEDEEINDMNAEI